MDWTVIRDWILERAKENTTWAGIATLIATVTGYTLAPDMVVQITTAATALSGIILIAIKQKGK